MQAMQLLFLQGSALGFESMQPFTAPRARGETVSCVPWRGGTCKVWHLNERKDLVAFYVGGWLPAWFLV